MRRCSACLGVMAMFVVLLTAPFFHMHQTEERGRHVSFVHAHLSELELPDSHPHDESEQKHSHAQARWVDVFTFDAFSPGIDWPIEFAVTPAIPQLRSDESVVLAFVPQAHGPPGGRPFSPRPPPSL